MDNSLLKLREETGAGVMDCKKALEESQGDLEKAKEIIFASGAAKAQKRAERKTGAGVLDSYIHNDRIGVLVELRCETDFVAKTDIFKSVAHEIAMHIAFSNPLDTMEILTQPSIKDESITIGDVITQLIARTGENCKLERFCRYEL